MQSTSKGTSRIVLGRVHIFFQYDIKSLISLYEAEFFSSGKSEQEVAWPLVCLPIRCFNIA